MEKTLQIPGAWAGIGAQLPLFLEHKHTVILQRIRIMKSKCVRVKWRCVDGDVLEGQEFSETFNLSKRSGKERLKAFVFAMALVPEDGKVNFENCPGKSIEVMAISRTTGRLKRIEILHYLLS